MQMLSQLLQMGRDPGSGGILSNRLRLALLQRDFTGDDYEMLQSLDDAGRARRGAEQSSIDMLPLHTVSAAEAERNASTVGGPPSCNICLGPFEEHEQVRTVPCMHQFHQHCIDTWLRERAICPVCKTRAVPAATE